MQSAGASLDGIAMPASHSNGSFLSIEERGAVDTATFEQEVVPSYRPIVLRGQFSGWPAVQAGLEGADSLACYLCGLAKNSPVRVMIGQPENEGRFFYSDDFSGVNFVNREVPFAALITELLRLRAEPRPPALYAGSSATENHFESWEDSNPVGLPLPGAKPRIWIGNAVQTATHFDTVSNVAGVVGGQRRFTLFPPEQIENLYVGPLEMTLAGQPVSMVDLECPDLDRYPRFSEAMRYAQQAILTPGDAIFIPALWWHHVASMSQFNVLVNYWWGHLAQTAAFPAMIHALLSIRDLGVKERAAWRHWFNHYIFQDNAGSVADHLPENVRGVLGRPSEIRTAKILAYLSHALDRSSK